MSLLALWVVALGALPSSRGCICLETYAQGLHHPLLMLHLPHKPHEFLVVEQHGVVLHFVGAHRPKPKPFLDLKKKFNGSLGAGTERGLLGLALAPDYDKTGLVYTYQTFSRAGREYSEVVRYDKNGNELVLLTIEKLTGHDNGGMLLFGEDDFLYIFVGYGGDGDSAQNRTTFLGKVLRIDVSKPPTIGRKYSVPPTNPFYRSDSLPEIYALGFKNPWRCSVDSGHPTTGSGHGRIFCGEAGADDYDEIDIVVKGGNYGWKIKEGNVCLKDLEACSNIVNEQNPIYVYNHTMGPGAVVGGYVYRGLTISDLQQKYIFGDAMSGSLMALNETASGWKKEDIPICTDNCSCNARHQGLSHILAFAQDSDGELYVLMVDEFNPLKRTGAIFKIVAAQSDTVKCAALVYPPHSVHVVLIFLGYVITTLV